MANASFDLEGFLPYLLNQAAEASSQSFQRLYKRRYGMLRTEWRVLFHLGIYGELSARDISVRASIHKTKVSRAVAALEARRYLSRTLNPGDRRESRLTLTPAGRAVYDDLRQVAAAHEAELVAHLSGDEVAQLKAVLQALAAKKTPPA